MESKLEIVWRRSCRGEPFFLPSDVALNPEEIAAPEISPLGTTVSCLQKQCKGIERELGL